MGYGGGVGFVALFKKRRLRHLPLERVPLDRVLPNPYQPRREYKEEDLQELAESIRHHGVLQPIIVRPSARGYEIVSGERRFRASQLAGKKDIPALIGNFSDGDLLEIALLENIQRRNLNVLEEGLGYSRLQDFYGAHRNAELARQLAPRLGKSAAEIEERLSMLDYPILLQKALERGVITPEQAQLLLPLKDQKLQSKGLEEFLRQGLTPTKAKGIVSKLQRLKKEESGEAVDLIETFEALLYELLGTIEGLGYWVETTQEQVSQGAQYQIIIRRSRAPILDKTEA